uniref:ATP-dependent RNA helicase n=1 Tax=Panagrellus redivivus TaxID=6233 RepID=A0A7E4UZ48_PANRE
MLRLTAIRSISASCSRAADQSLIKQVTERRRRNPADQFGLIGKGFAPQTEKLVNSRWIEGFVDREKVVNKVHVHEKRIRSRSKEITQPATISNKKRVKMVEKKALMAEYQRKYGVDKRNAHVVIDCKRPEYNHYEGQRYPSPKEIPLVSEFWEKPKYSGDYFVLKRSSKLAPSVLQPEERDWNLFGNIIDYAILRNITDVLNLKTPTKIQDLFLQQYELPMHLFIAGETGSGKTIAYGAPMLSEVLKSKGTKKAIVLVINSYLRTQTANFLNDIAHGTPLNLVECKKNTAFESLDDFDVLIGTPARVAAVLKQFPIEKLANTVSTIVMDEADVIMDESFVESMTEFLAVMPVQHSVIEPESAVGPRVIFSSATCPNELQDLVEGIVSEKHLIYVKSKQLHRLLPNVEQKFVRITLPSRWDLFLDLVEEEIQNASSGQTLVFCKDTARVALVAAKLRAAGVECATITKGRSHVVGDVRFLISTDAGSRGLDLPDLAHVINYDFPRHLVDYVHRVGRVGRCNTKHRPRGRVTSFVRASHEIKMVHEIERAIRLNSPLQGIETDVAGMLKARRTPNKDD